MNDYAERVARGVEVLDRIKPEWRTLVNPHRLNIGSSARCIIGQVFDWSAGLDILWEKAGIDSPRPELAHYGFEITDYEGEDCDIDHYALLTDAWLEVLHG